MELKPALKRLHKSSEFKGWVSKNKEAFFSYAFKMIEDNADNSWQIGFYNKPTDKITTFIVEEGSIERKEEEEVFKKPDTSVKQIDIEKVKLSFKEILEKTEDFKKKEYSKELVSRTIAILQNLEGYGTVWNITYVTHTFSTLNMKVSPENGKVLHHSLESIMDFAKK